MRAGLGQYSNYYEFKTAKKDGEPACPTIRKFKDLGRQRDLQCGPPHFFGFFAG